MLKRKANACSVNIFDDSEDNFLSTSQEIHQRKIFRAKRPTRNVSQSSPSKFQIKSQLISLEEELKLLSISTKPKIAGGSHHNENKLENSYGSYKFSSYLSVEPLKEIIQNINTDESLRLKGFLDSNIEKNDAVIKFSVDCKLNFKQNTINALCKIVTNRDKSAAFLVIQGDKSDEILINKKITRSTLCKEIENGSSSVFIITFSKDNTIEESVRLKISSISKHLFLRCFSQCKLQS